jgi:Protein of unknown function (DUF3500)
MTSRDQLLEMSTERNLMFKKTKVLAGIIAASLCGACSVYSFTLAVTAQTPATDAQSTKVVTAANAFLATLSDAQQKSVLFAFTDAAQRVRWSNFPQGAFNRVGLGWAQMTATQRTALMSLLGTVLSPDGLSMVKGQMNADSVIKATNESASNTAQPSTQSTTPPAANTTTTPPAGNATPPSGGNRPSVNFGSEYYYVSFVGTPSTTSPWMLQFGGHHLAINATVVGPNITLAPSLTGGQPVKVSTDGKTFTLIPQVPVEMKAAFAMLDSLSATQRSKTVISSQQADLVLGPGQDGKTLQTEGLPGSEMTDAQKTLFLALIQSRLGILNADNLVVKMLEVQTNLDKTYFAWYGSTASDSAAYYRVIGPTLAIEFAPQSGDGDATNHLHSMYRDPTNDYGAAWTK